VLTAIGRLFFGSSCGDLFACAFDREAILGPDL
jgi:hypothetical protein